MTDNLIEADIRHKVEGNTLIQKAQQHLPTSFLDRIRETRAASRNAPMGNFHHVASIPEALVSKWKAEGFDIFDRNVSVKEILHRLHSQDLQAFIATDRRI